MFGTYGTANSGFSAPAAYMPSDIKLMLDEVANGRLNPAIDRVMPLEDVREAMTLLEERKLFGKVILNP